MEYYVYPEIELTDSGRAIYRHKVYPNREAAEVQRTRDNSEISLKSLVEREVFSFKDQEMIEDFLINRRYANELINALRVYFAD